MSEGGWRATRRHRGANKMRGTGPGAVAFVYGLVDLTVGMTDLLAWTTTSGCATALLALVPSYDHLLRS